jgi:hypothetical protein
MAARKKPSDEAEIAECIEPHCTALTDANGNSYDAVFRRGDRLPADHPVVQRAFKFWLPLGHTVIDEAEHRRRHGLHGRG